MIWPILWLKVSFVRYIAQIQEVCKGYIFGPLAHFFLVTTSKGTLQQTG